MIAVIDLKNDKPSRVDDVLAYALAGATTEEDRRTATDPVAAAALLRELAAAGEARILFVVRVTKSGRAAGWEELIAWFHEGEVQFQQAAGVVLVDGEGELFTKDIARRLIFAANTAGIAFPGKPLVEATGNLYNFSTSARVSGIDPLEAYRRAARNLVDKLAAFRLTGGKADNADNADHVYNGEENGAVITGHEKLKVACLHASSRETSNSLLAWALIKEKLGERAEVTEVSLRNGEIVDCRGCGFHACKHMGESGDCFYGGLMVEEVYPAVLACDALVLICPNYNDAVGANLTAMFNRLTALFYNNDFSSKRVYAIVISGYSGGDLLAEQVIGAMCCNKGFQLPPRFALLKTANDPGSILRLPELEEEAVAFAGRMLGE